MYKFKKFKHVIILVLISCVLISCSNSNNVVTNVKETEEKTPDNVMLPFQISDIEDNFGDKTGEKMISGTFIGVFSNSATINSECYFSLIYSHGQFKVVIFEYAKYIKTGTDDYTFEFKDDTGNKYKVKARATTDKSTWLIVDSNNKTSQEFLRALRTSKNINVYMENVSRKVERYSFEVDTKNFNELYNEFYNELSR